MPPVFLVAPAFAVPDILDEDFFLAYYENRLDANMRARLVLPRQALHATRVVFRHPLRGESFEITAPLPDDLREFAERLTRGEGQPS